MKRVNQQICLSLGAVLLLTGCGGGGGGPSVPTQDNNGTVNPNPTPNDPIADRVTALGLSPTEYYANPALNMVGAVAAYEEGYTGAGIKVAVIDNGLKTGWQSAFPNVSSSNIMESIDVVTYTGNNGVSFNGAVGYTRTQTTIGADQVAGVSYTVTNSGHIYGTAPDVVITGDGTGATAKALLDTQGHLVGIYMTNPGTGYTNASVTVVDGSGNITSAKVELGGISNDGHGTFVSSQIVAPNDGKGILGIAYNSQLYSIDASVVGDGSSISIDKAISGVSYAMTQGVNVINQSFGGAGSIASYANINVYKDALAANISIVNAAGNNGSSCTTLATCSGVAALPWENGMSDMLTKNGAWIVVGALNADGSDIASYSNRAGITKSNYILAPGTGNVGTGIDSNGNAYTYSANGTSFATPIVTGAMALMYQKWPTLTGNQMAQILFKTADDMGVAGVDDIYGNGKLNLNKAFSPVGVLSVPVAAASIQTSGASTATTSNLGGSVLRTGTAMAKLQSFAPLNNTIGLDSFNRDFKLSMTSAIGTAATDGTDVMNFDNFSWMNYKSLTFGVDQSYNRFAIGWKPSSSSSISFTHTDDLFGTTGEGLFGMANPQTYYINARKSFKTEDMELQVQGTYGYGTANSTNGSLISNISSVQGLGGKIKASYDGFGLSYEIPMHVVNGGMTFALPVGVDASGSISTQETVANLSPNSIEQQFGAFYDLVQSNGRFLAQYIHTENKMNISGMSDDEVRFMYRYFY
ncbi:MAG: S8 family serine peptidase [Paludibacter sp.]|nr:S8 family serine peptidase [Paludibacter sp.]